MHVTIIMETPKLLEKINLESKIKHPSSWEYEKREAINLFEKSIPLIAEKIYENYELENDGAGLEQALFHFNLTPQQIADAIWFKMKSSNEYRRKTGGRKSRIKSIKKKIWHLLWDLSLKNAEKRNRDNLLNTIIENQNKVNILDAYFKLNDYPTGRNIKFNSETEFRKTILANSLFIDFPKSTLYQAIREYWIENPEIHKSV